MGTTADDQAAFETFYKDVRQRLLLQTWALTGDLSAAQKAVRDAFIVAWHHWRKLRRLHDAGREDWLRPLAWQRAQRRHSVPHLHRDRGVDEDARATLSALGKLPVAQRKVLLLSALTSIDVETLSREVGITKSRTEEAHRAALAQLAQLRGIPVERVPELFPPLSAALNHAVADRPWPRATIITRAGAARRRTHTLAGAVAGCAALLASGVVVSHAATTRPSLESLSFDGHRPTAAAAHLHPDYPLTSAQLLTDSTVSTAFPGVWSTQLTSSTGTTSLPCAPRSSADQHPIAALVRTFAGPEKKDLTTESVTVSASTASAQAAYSTTLGWVAGCALPRTQLIDTERLTGVGDQATLIGLRDWSDPARSLVVGVARSGSLTTAVAASVPRTPKSALPMASAALAEAVRPLCGLPGAGACVGTPQAREIAPLPVGAHPGLLDVVDLPPATSVHAPWAQTAPQPATTNPAASHCDETTFTGPTVTGGLTRTFLVTKDSPGVQFGMSETVGLLPSPAAARAFLHSVEGRLGACAKRELGSKATRLGSPGAADGATISLWKVQVGSKRSTVTYLMALVRRGRAVAQLSFIPTGRATIDTASFSALAERAGERLGALAS